MHRLWKSTRSICGYRDRVSCMNRLLTRAVRFVLSTRAAVADSSRRTTLTGILLLSVANPYTAQASQSKDELLLYAHSRIIDYKQFQCFIKVINKESRWNVNAKNGSHFGLGQMRSEHYRNLDAYRQIDASIKYITNRYSNPCTAWAFHQSKGYY